MENIEITTDHTVIPVTVPISKKFKNRKFKEKICKILSYNKRAKTLDGQPNFKYKL